MTFKVLLLIAVVTFVNAGYLEPVPAALRLSLHATAPAASLVSPAITKTEYIPGSYSSSFRTDVISPRVKYTETPGISIAVPQPSIAIAPAVTRVEHIAPVIPVLPTVEKYERIERIIPSLPAVAKVAHLAPVQTLIPAIPAVTRVDHIAQVANILPTLPVVTKVEHIASAPLITAPAVAKTIAIESAPLVHTELGLAGHRLIAPLPLTRGLVSHTVAHF